MKAKVKTMARLLLMVVLVLCFGTVTQAANLVVNGDFETGDDTGWTTLSQGSVVAGGVDGTNPYQGNYSLHSHITAWGDVAWSQDIAENLPQVSAQVYLTSFTAVANMSVRVEGYSGATKKSQSVYYWGGENWDWYNGAGPAQTGGFYATKEYIGNATGAWQQLIADPAADTDATFGAGIWTSLNIDHITLTLTSWSDTGNSIEGYFDNASVVPEPCTMILLGIGSIGVLLRRRRSWNG